MEAAVEERFEYLESVLGQFIVRSSTSLGRLERSVSRLSDEMREFKNEMREFKNEMSEFKNEMSEFKNEMHDFKDEMLDFKDEMREFKEESRADRKHMNRKWGELANKMGTVVEDIVAPSLGGIAREYFKVDEFDFFAVRLKKKNHDGSVRREFDVVAESRDFFFVVETKATPRTEYIRKFIEFVPELASWFPDAKEKKIIPVFASLYLPEDSIKYLTNNNIFAMAMKEDNMNILNFQLLRAK